MALLALLVALGGLTISLLTYLRGRPPKPEMRVTFQKLPGNPHSVFPPDREPTILTRIENVGGDIAYKVVISRKIEVSGRTVWSQLSDPQDWKPGTYHAWHAELNSPKAVKVQWVFPRSSTKQREKISSYSAS